jgi:hypothetical protein
MLPRLDHIYLLSDELIPQRKVNFNSEKGKKGNDSSAILDSNIHYPTWEFESIE